MKDIILLGASGSVGTQSLEVIRDNPDLFNLKALTVGNRDENLEALIEEFNLEAVALRNDERRETLSHKYPHVKFYGVNSITDLINNTKADIALNAIVGIAGLKPTITAIENNMDIALANKETLVTGGDLILDLAKKHKVSFLPVDSEHSAIWQALHGNNHKDVNEIVLTASGGSFRDLNRDELKGVTKEDALNHPNWSMGQKITIDSATMMNKGLEVIEAHYLFDLPYSKINVLIHEQSVVHSYVQFNDFSILAQMGTTNMKLPIQFALTYPRHLHMSDNKALNLAKIKTLTFKEVDFERFPLVVLAYQVGKEKGNKPIIMNAANEVAVHLFLNDKISFIDIETIVMNTVYKYDYEDVESFDKIYKIDETVRHDVEENYIEILEMVKTW